jgi:NADH:ubiquinone oxidoreductase subunit K
MPKTNQIFFFAFFAPLFFAQLYGALLRKKMFVVYLSFEQLVLNGVQMMCVQLLVDRYTKVWWLSHW